MAAANPSPQQLFSAAERAYLSGRLDESRRLLAQLDTLRQPAVYHLRALVERDLGDLPVARHYFERAIALAPGDSQLWNNFGILLEQIEEQDGALDAYCRAVAIAPRFADPLYNRALLLRRLGRTEDARADFLAAIALNGKDPRFWIGLGALEKDASDLGAAASAYDHALALCPAAPLAAAGRARVALERGESTALQRYRSARHLAPQMADLLIDETEVRLALGETEALEELASATAKQQTWVSGQVALARMRWEHGSREGFADHIESALAANPQHAELWREYIQLLLACDLPALAADAASRAGCQFAGDAEWLLVEATMAGKAGQLERAEALFAKLPGQMPGRPINEAVHRIRLGDFEHSLMLVERALEGHPEDFAVWAIAELLYRKLGDPRATWLSGQPGLIGVADLPIEAADFADADALLYRLHHHAIQTIGQSVRGGSQTRWNLFDRVEPQLGPLKSAAIRGNENYVRQLSSRDETHPLLRQLGRPLRITASWSVLLQGSGYHHPHYHPKGLISSACYFRVPPAGTSLHSGWLEIGRPPPDLGFELEPIMTVEPLPGRLVLFPSFLCHGTRPFSAGERMSVAFDVAAA